MGFRNGSWATCWSVEPRSDAVTKVRLSTSRKNKNTEEYEQDFSGFVSFVGTAAAGKAAKLKERDRIRLKEVDVTTFFDQERSTTYTNFICYSFETQDAAPEQEKLEKYEEEGDEQPNEPEGAGDLPW